VALVGAGIVAGPLRSSDGVVHGIIAQSADLTGTGAKGLVHGIGARRWIDRETTSMCSICSIMTREKQNACVACGQTTKSSRGSSSELGTVDRIAVPSRCCSLCEVRKAVDPWRQAAPSHRHRHRQVPTGALPRTTAPVRRRTLPLVALRSDGLSS
jgi:hypothetical protein